MVGTVNTFVLVTSSFLVAMSLDAARRRPPRLTAGFLAAGAGLGMLFTGLKACEWAAHAREGIVPGRELFFTLYYTMTGLHAGHVVAGIAILAWMAVRAWRGAYGPARHEHVKLEMGTLYWHLVDLVWLFLWPMFYLVR